MTENADYIVFADESGDHGLDSIDPQFPVFCLSLCLIRIEDYTQGIVPSFQKFKFDFWGHDAVVLHEHEIRKSTGRFGILRTDPNLRNSFYERLNGLMEDAPMTVFASVINKVGLKARYKDPGNPYEIALLFCMERLLECLLRNGQKDKLVHVLFESRGKQEDNELEIEFRRICANAANWGYKRSDFTTMRFEPIFVSKAANSTGLQLADLTARPIALKSIRPDQANRAFDIIEPKIGGRKQFP